MSNIPVIMFHSVGCDIYPWSRSFLSTRLPQFERFCKYLKEKSYHALFLAEWYELENSAIPSKGKYVVLTFDDGYLDNYVYVYPILKKYGLKGTIFVNPEFVDLANTIPRRRFDQKEFDINDDKNVLGFLNWAEITEMENSGVMDIQNHTMSHNKYFSGTSIQGFLTPKSIDKYDWLLWEKKPELKPNYMHINLFDYIHEGFPIFENNRSLAIRRYFPDEQLIEILIDKYKYEKNRNNKSVFEIEEKLKKEYSMIPETGKYAGRYETDEEMTNRYKYEIGESRKIFQEKLNKRTDFLCWPGGGWNETSLQIADELGYKASTARYRSTIEKDKYQFKHRSILRKGISDIYSIRGKYLRSSNPDILIDKLLAQNGSQIIRRKLQIYKLFKYAGAFFSK